MSDIQPASRFRGAAETAPARGFAKNYAHHVVSDQRPPKWPPNFEDVRSGITLAAEAAAAKLKSQVRDPALLRRIAMDPRRLLMDLAFLSGEDRTALLEYSEYARGKSKAKGKVGVNGPVQSLAEKKLAPQGDLLLAYELFSGRNIYSACVLGPPGYHQDGLYSPTYEMWYGGWQADLDYDQAKDSIYYRSSFDNEIWSDFERQYTPNEFQAQAYPLGGLFDPAAQFFQHVNDPAVTRFANTYTMFFTACAVPCHEGDNQIWSVVSNDGKNWRDPVPLLVDYASGPGEPSAIVDFDPETGTVWKVYYINYTHSKEVYMARVDGNRNAISVERVYRWDVANPSANDPMMGNIQNPEVRRINGVWYLFFNLTPSAKTEASSATGWGVYVVKSSQNTVWPWLDPKLVVAAATTSSFGLHHDATAGYEMCAAMAPGVLPTTFPNEYDLYFGMSGSFEENSKDPGRFVCNARDMERMLRWRMRVPSW